MASPSPLVTVTMPILNGASTVEDAVNSLRLQSLDDWELLVVDDGSTDGSIDVVRSLGDRRIRVLADGRHLGLPSRLNQAIDAARGRYLARLDADDVAYPDRLAHQVRYLESHEGVDLLGSEMVVFRGEGEAVGKRGGWRREPGAWSGIVRWIPMGHSTFMGRLSWFRRNPYPTAARASEDQLLLMSSLPHSRLAILDEILVGFREDRRSLSKQRRYRLAYLPAFGYLVRRMGLAKAAAVVLVRVGKLAVETVVIPFGLDPVVQKSRVRPLGESESAAWARTWDRVVAERRDRRRWTGGGR